MKFIIIASILSVMLAGIQAAPAPWKKSAAIGAAATVALGPLGLAGFGAFKGMKALRRRRAAKKVNAGQGQPQQGRAQDQDEGEN